MMTMILVGAACLIVGLICGFLLGAIYVAGETPYADVAPKASIASGRLR